MTGLMLLAAALSVAGIWLVRRAWDYGRDKRPRARRLALSGGWGLLVAAVWPWSLAAGGDRGVALAFLVPVLGAFVLLAAIGRRESRRGGRRAQRNKPANGNGSNGIGARLFARRVWIFLLAGPLSALAAFLLSAQIYYRWPADWDDANRLAAVLLFAPFAWAVLAVWSTYDSRLRVRGAVLAGFLLLGLA